MGYSIDFDGSIKIIPKLPEKLVEIVNDLSHGYNNTHGKGDLYSFDHAIHHLIGKPDLPKKKHSYGFLAFASSLMKIQEATRVPDRWCHWELRNEDDVTYIKWDGGEKFYEYLPWLQYMIDFATLYAKHAFDIDIQQLDGSIKWEGEGEGDNGLILVSLRTSPELTGFYPDGFLPLPTIPKEESKRICDNAVFQKPNAPKGDAFMSRFKVEAIVESQKPLCPVGNFFLQGSIANGGYVLLLEQQPDCKFLTFHVHHERSRPIYHPNDPQFQLKEPEVMGSQDYVEWLFTPAAATSTHAPSKSLKSIADDTVDKLDIQDQGEETKAHINDPTSTSNYRKCSGCGGRFDGQAYQLAMWYWPHGYSGMYVLTIYCSSRCVYKIDD